jgi:hypothetical protein
MKIRYSSKDRCGAFNLHNLTETLNVSDTSARKSLKLLTTYGYIKQIKKGLFRVISFKTLIGDNLHERFFKISENDIFSYSWKNISHFRALLVELKVQINRNSRKRARKGFTKIDRHGAVDKIKSQSKKEFDTLVASTYSAKMTGKSYSTILRYRTRQRLVNYANSGIKSFKNNSELINCNFSIGKEFIFGSLLIFSPISVRNGKVKINGY